MARYCLWDCLRLTKVAVLVAFGATALAQPITFVGRRDVPAGVNPWAVATGDFNGDGKPDLAVTNFAAGTVSILLGNGDGSFQTPQTVAVGSSPRGLAVGDFNGDGKLDIVVANSGSNNVSILLGKGDGTFQTAVTYSTGTTPYAVAVGDFNGDNKPDLVVVNNGVNSVSVLLGNGDGTFQAAAQYSTGNLPCAVAIGDLNGDHKPDLVVANTQSSTVSILLGNGNGTFQAATSVTVGTYPTGVVIADLDGDGKADLATANSGANSVSVLLGNGNGTFQARNDFFANVSPSAIAAGDLNGDGIPDLVVANSGSNDVSVLIGMGSGVYRAAVNYALSGSPYSMVLADLNGDGKLDLALPCYFTAVMSVLTGNGNGTFQTALSRSGGNMGGQTIAVGDINGDGKADLIWATQNSVQIALGNGDGTYKTPTTMLISSCCRALLLADFNGDGKLDLVVAPTNTSVSVSLGNGDGTFQNPVYYTVGSNTEMLLAADFNKDGKLDLAVADAQGTVYILLGDGHGAFAAPVPVAMAAGLSCCTYTALAVADFNGDGKLDLAAAAGYNGLAIALGKGDGTFQAPTVLTSVGAVDVLAGDFNGDGKADLLVTFGGSNGTLVSILLGAGDGTFGAPQSLPALSGYFFDHPVLADLNNDGKLDLALNFYTSGQGPAGVAVYRGRGNATFDPPVLWGGLGAYWLLAADLNGDGKPDLVAYGTSISSLLNNTVIGPANTIASIPAGRNFSADGVAYVAPQTFYWTVGSAHTVSLPTPQTSGSNLYTFTGWADGDTSNPRTITVVAGGGTYTANFSTTTICSYSLGGNSSIGATGGSGTVTVTAPAGCAWTASSDSQWLAITSGTGAGNGSIGYTAAANTSQTSRTAQVSAGGVSFAITQTGGASCTYSLGGSNTIPAAGGTASVTVTATAGCGWIASSDSQWLTITSGTGVGIGNGSIGYTAALNPNPAQRTAQVSAGGSSFAITQAAGIPCSYIVTPLSFTMYSSGGTGTVNVAITGTSCNWTGTSNASWITVTNVTGGATSGTVSFSVAAGTQARSGTLTVAGQTVTVSQIAPGGPCGGITFPTLPTLDAAGGSGTLAITTPVASCSWQISASASWLLLYPTAGLGNAQVNYVAQPNSSTTQRTATLTAAGTTATITQSGRSTCTATLSPAGLTFTGAGGSADVSVGTDPGCSWNTTVNASWIGIAGTTVNGDGGGGGTLSLAVAANTTGSPRYGTLTISDQTLPVVQTAASPSAGTRFVALTPCRIADTRYDQGKSGAFGPGFLAAAGSRDIPMALSGCNVPGTARAYSLNITVVPYGPLGFLTVWPQGQSQPLASNLNAPTGTVVANAAIIPAGAGGGISLYASDPTDVIVDINGYFVGSDVSTGLAFYPLTPCRVMDTRAGMGTTGAFGPPSMPTGGSTRTVPVPQGRCSVPTAAAAYSVNFTVVPTGKLGFLAAWPSGQTQPLVSTLNSWDGAVLANAAIVPAGPGGSINVYTLMENGATTDVIMDINGYFAPMATGGLSLYPVTPCRAVDTRTGQGKTGAFGPPSMPSGGSSRTFPLPTSTCSLPSTAQAYAMNVTAVPAGGSLDYLTIWPTGLTMPVVSTLNSWDGRVVANAATVRAGTSGAVNVFTQVGAAATADVVLDVFGYFAP